MIPRVYYLCILLLSLQFISNAMEPRKPGIVTPSQLGDEVEKVMLARINEGNVANAAVLENCCIEYIEKHLAVHNCNRRTISICQDALMYLKSKYSRFVSPLRIVSSANIQDYALNFSNGNMCAVYLAGGDAGTVRVVRKDERMRWRETDIIRFVPGTFVRYACSVSGQGEKKECVAIESWKKSDERDTAICLYDKELDKGVPVWKKRAAEINLTDSVFAYGFSPGGLRAALVVKSRNDQKQSIVVYDLIEGKYTVAAREPHEGDARRIIWKNQKEFLIRMSQKSCRQAVYEDSKLTIDKPVDIHDIQFFAIALILQNKFRHEKSNQNSMIVIDYPMGAIANRLYKTMVVAQSKNETKNLVEAASAAQDSKILNADITDSSPMNSIEYFPRHWFEYLTENMSERDKSALRDDYINFFKKLLSKLYHQ